MLRRLLLSVPVAAALNLFFPLFGHNQGKQASYTGSVFEDVAPKSGLTVPHISSPDKRYVIESMSGGVGLFDCDNDGRLDIVTVNGSTVERYREGGDPMVTLYHQQADGTFTDITKAAGLTRRGWGMGVAVADFDNDGLLDLYVTGYGGNVLYHNLGNCKFEDVTEKAGVRGGGFSTGAAWADYDRDGHVDLFVSRYVHVDINNLPEFGRDKFCRYKGVLVQCGPWGLQGESDLLFHNRGDGTFEEVSVRAGVRDSEGRFGLGAVWGDYDNDGWPDLFVANDAGANYLYHNNHNGTFTDVAMLAGVALSGVGQEQGNMGVDFGDYNHTGRLSIIDTTFADQPKTLYRNLGSEGFDDVSRTAQIAQVSLPHVAWGTGFVDFDNDGWLDVLIANGHVYPQVDTIKEGARYKEPLFLHLNKHDGTFEEVSAPAGLADLPLASRRGVAFGDVWNDGAVDALILNVGEPPTLLRNHLANGNHWVEFKLEGAKSNRAAIGARINVRSGALVQFNEVRGGASYLSQNDLRLHFGLAANPKIDTVEITWPSGLVQRLQDLSVDRLYTIEEGKGIRPPGHSPSP
jgi:enediyne biosynthesis protein E4